MKASTLASLAAASAALLLAAATPALAATHGAGGGMDQMMKKQSMMSPGLVEPEMDSARGRSLFGAKGCAVCHAINGVGGEDAPPLDASEMDQVMNPFEFAARMWRGAEAMIYLQRDELGDQITFTGQELADIIAFVHDPAEQRKFSRADIPEQIRAFMHEQAEGDDHDDEEPHGEADDDHHGEEEEAH